MDIWDWIRGLRKWWWMLVAFPLLAAGLTWILAPESQYATTWTANLYFDEPLLADDPAYVDFALLDDLHMLVGTGALGDVIYQRLPEDTRATLSREAFGEMVSSSRKAHFVEITVSGDDPDQVNAVATALDANLQEVANQYLIPADYRGGPVTVNRLDPLLDATINDRPFYLTVAAITVATGLVALAATGVAEWLTLSYRAKNAAR